MKITSKITLFTFLSLSIVSGQHVYPGLYEKDGTPHSLHQPNPVTGQTLNVVDFGADPQDSDQDDSPAVQATLAQAQYGDEVYFPSGVYNFRTTANGDSRSHLLLKSGVNLRGERMDACILKSEFGDETIDRFLKMRGLNNICISNLTMTSRFTGSYSTITDENNPQRGGPKYVISIEDASGTPSSNITVDSVLVENYRTHGVRLSNSHDVIVRNSVFQNATDVGGGGAGYGVSIQGDKTQDNQSAFNVVEHCRFLGPYIRHGVILQYATHNNAVRFNFCQDNRLDALDLHGEDEYLNEIHGNEIRDIRRGAGVGVGNTGSTHDRSGPHNYIHDNTMINCREGVKVYLGSPDTRIENNTITGSSVSNGKGIFVLNGPRTVVRENWIYDNPGASFTGIYLQYDGGTAGKGQGPPRDVHILENTVTGNDYGVRMYAGEGIVYKDNNVSDNRRGDFYASDGVIFHNLLSVTTSGEGWVELDPPGAGYKQGAVVLLHANRAANWKFDHWEGVIGGSQNPAEIVMDASKSVTAVFTQKAGSDEVMLATTVVGSGSIALDPSGGIYDRGAEVIVRAVPDSGWKFSGWDGDLAGEKTQASLVMDDEKSVIATFVPVPMHPLLTWISGAGHVELDPPAESFVEGTVVTIRAVPDDGWRFKSWGGSLSGSENPVMLTMDAPKAISVAFERITGIVVRQEPYSFELHQNYPNPFNASTTISFTLQKSGPANVSVYDTRGRLVHVVLDQVLDAGFHSVSYDASGLPSGVYFYRLTTTSFQAMRRFSLLK